MTTAVTIITIIAAAPLMQVITVAITNTTVSVW